MVAELKLKQMVKVRPLWGANRDGQVQVAEYLLHPVVASAVLEAELVGVVSWWLGYPRGFHPAHIWVLK